MNPKISIASLLSFFFIFLSCKQKSSLELALEFAGDNRVELEKVLSHYRGDTLKYKAACFLIENLPYHHFYEGDAVENYHKLYELHSSGKYYPEEVVDTIAAKYGFFNYSNARIRHDLDSITAGYLIENIDWAFKVRQEQPWGEQVSFENFCEYILPYRIADEPLVSWRKAVYEQFNPILDSIRTLPEAADPLFVSEILLDSLQRRSPFYFSYVFHGPHVGPEIVNWYSGYCRESTDIFIYICRALGIPCGRDFLSVRGDRNTGHEWNFVLDKNGKSYYGAITYGTSKMEPVDTYWWKKGKVLRETFGVNKRIRSRMSIPAKKIHPKFRAPRFTDATSLYLGERNRCATIPPEKLYHQVDGDEPIYLCMASWKKWEPVAVSYLDDNVFCPDIEENIVFRLATYEKEALRFLSDPFLVEPESHELRFFEADRQAKERVVLFHKFELDYVFPWRMVGGMFEGSNRADFSQADTLFRITNRPVRLWNVAHIPNNKAYRYVRYMGPENSYCDVAEIAFYSQNDTVPLKGAAIGTPNVGELKKTHEYTNALDGDPNTSFDYHLADGGWVGLDLKTQKSITKIVYTARNHDNFIRVGNRYELFYDRKGQWVSLGNMNAATDSLVYEIPKGALLYLKNHTTGKDERIFEYRNGEQIFK